MQAILRFFGLHGAQYVQKLNNEIEELEQYTEGLEQKISADNKKTKKLQEKNTILKGQNQVQTKLIDQLQNNAKDQAQRIKDLER